MEAKTIISVIAAAALSACAPQFNEASNNVGPYPPVYLSSIGHTVNAVPLDPISGPQAAVVTVHDANTASIPGDIHPIDLDGAIYICGSHADDKEGLNNVAEQFIIHASQDVREKTQNFFDARAEIICGLSAELG